MGHEGKLRISWSLPAQMLERAVGLEAKDSGHPRSEIIPQKCRARRAVREPASQALASGGGGSTGCITPRPQISDLGFVTGQTKPLGHAGKPWLRPWASLSFSVPTAVTD